MDSGANRRSCRTGQMPLAPAPAVAHYGQGIFEGFKAFPRANGGAALFRPDANHARMSRTCQRMAMPEIPASIFVEGTAALVRVDLQWIPAKPGSALYIRPVMFATGEPLGVRPSEKFRFIIETCPSGPYFSGSVDLLAEETYVRAFPGGTGAAKCGGNYAGSMLAAIEAQKKGFHNVLWLDGIERRYVEEAGLMNVVFVIDGTIVTPPLSGTILPGITRDSCSPWRARWASRSRNGGSPSTRCSRPTPPAGCRARPGVGHGRDHRAHRPPAPQGPRNYGAGHHPRLAPRSGGRGAGRHTHRADGRPARVAAGVYEDLFIDD